MKPLACITGFKKLDQSQPNGTNHAGMLSIQALARCGRFEKVDLFFEEANAVVRRGTLDAAIIPVPGSNGSHYDLVDLFYSPGIYSAVYSAGGGLIAERELHVVRPYGDSCPLISEIDCTHSRAQWKNLFLAAFTGSLRPTDGLIFKSDATCRTFNNVWEYWRETLAVPSPMPRHMVSPNPIDRSVNRRDLRYRSKVRDQLGIKEDSVVFLTFSRIERNTKGDIESLLSCWKHIRNRHNNGHLIIAGATFEADYIVDLRGLMYSLGISGSVWLLPNPFDLWSNARTQLMSTADVFLHLSTGFEESAPLTILEAMSHQLPVVVAGWSGLPEQVNEGVNGFVVPTYWFPFSRLRENITLGADWNRSGIEASLNVSLDYSRLESCISHFLLVPNAAIEMGLAAERFVSQEREVMKTAHSRADFVGAVVEESNISKPATMRQKQLIPMRIVQETLSQGSKFDDSISIETGSQLPSDYCIGHWIPTRFAHLGHKIVAIVSREAQPIKSIVDLLIEEGGCGDGGIDSEVQEELREIAHFVIFRLIASGTLRSLSVDRLPVSNSNIHTIA